ncbi:MAG: alpha-hydroxy-acid oxidizing protein [Acidimicrobiales bacterium]|nr:alpha-hydroxy-acid oxidizing protein [Acidimicrobiales bacterium]
MSTTSTDGGAAIGVERYLGNVPTHLTPADLRAAAEAALPRPVFDYLDGGAELERTVAANVAAYDSVVFEPRVLVDVSSVTTATTVLGRELSLPLVCSPTAFQKMVHPDGEAGAARAAASHGVAFCVSTSASTHVRDIRTAAGDDAVLWFQMYFPGRADATTLLGFARDAGCDAVVLTVDTPLTGARFRDVRNAMTLPPVVDDRSIWAERPDWVAAYQGQGPVRQEMMQHLSDPMNIVNAAMAWDDVEWLREHWDGALVLKGLSHPDDARRGAETGVDAVWVSNHGGRQLDRAPATLSSLPAVAEAVAGRCEVLVDGGIRTGADLAAARALGAVAGGIGRPYLWGLASGGEAGVGGVLTDLRSGLERTLALLGCADVNLLTAAHIRGTAR